MAISIKQGWQFAAEEIARDIDPSGTTFSEEVIAEMLKTGKYTTAIALVNAAGLDASAYNISNGWIDTFTRIDNKLNP